MLGGSGVLCWVGVVYCAGWEWCTVLGGSGVVQPLSSCAGSTVSGEGPCTGACERGREPMTDQIRRWSGFEERCELQGSLQAGIVVGCVSFLHLPSIEDGEAAIGCN